MSAHRNRIITINSKYTNGTQWITNNHIFKLNATQFAPLYIPLLMGTEFLARHCITKGADRKLGGTRDLLRRIRCQALADVSLDVQKVALHTKIQPPSFGALQVPPSGAQSQVFALLQGQFASLNATAQPCAQRQHPKGAASISTTELRKNGLFAIDNEFLSKMKLKKSDFQFLLQQVTHHSMMFKARLHRLRRLIEG